MAVQMIVLRDLIYAASVRGAKLEKVCQEIGFDPTELNNSEIMVPYDRSAKVWAILVEQTNDPFLGLHIGQEINSTMLGMLGYLMQSSRTLLEAYSVVSKFYEFSTSMARFYIEEKNDEIMIHFETDKVWQHEYPECARQSAECAFSAAIKISMMLTGKKIYPKKVEFIYPERSMEEYHQIFKSNITFGHVGNVLTFSRNDLLCAIISYDKSLYELLSTTLEQRALLANMERKISDQLKQIIITDFKGQTPSVEIAALHLKMTSRSLQRKLKEEGTSYREIINEFKKEVAQTILNQKKFRINEIAEMLGYSDPSSLRKAIKKWSIHL